MTANSHNSTLKLTTRETEQWQDNGFFVRENQFSPTEIERLRNAAMGAAAKAHEQSINGKTYHLDNKKFVDIDCSTVQYEHSPGTDTVRVLEPVNSFSTDIDALADDPRLAMPMLDLIGGEQLALWTVKLNLKHANGSAFGWHQDSPYWVHDCNHVDLLPNVMLTLDPQHRSNGCFRIIRGSHQQGILPGSNDGSQLGGFFTHPDHFDANQEVLLEVGAGALIFFSPHCVHGSQSNTSKDSRRALIFTYQPGGFAMLKTAEVRNISL